LDVAAAKTRNPPSLSLLIALTAAGPLALNIFIPSMPGMVTTLGTDYATVQLTLTLYLAAMGGAQIIIGPVSDRFGRRPAVIGGMLLFIGGSLACAFAPNIETLIIGRVIQAAGGCTGMVMSRTIIRDMHGMDKAASMIGYVTMVMVIAPILAPTIGGFLDSQFDWRAGFHLSVAYAAVVLLFIYALLGETHKGPFRAESAGVMFLNFVGLLGQFRFNRHALQIAFSSGAFFAFLGGVPYVSINLMGITPAQYGFFFMFGGVFYMLGNFITGRKSEKWGARRLITLGTSIGLTGGAFLIVVHATGSLTPLTLFGGMAIIALGNGLSLPSGTAGAVSADPTRVGAASGLAGFMQIVTGALASYIVGLLLSDSAVPMITVMSACVTLAFGIHMTGLWVDRRSALRREH